MIDPHRSDLNGTDSSKLDNARTMSSPAPLLRPPIPGANRSGTRAPRLGLAIPPSPSQKPIAGDGGVPEIPQLPQLHKPSSRPMPPQLRLATPQGSNATPQESISLPNGRPPPQSHAGNSASGASDASGHSRSGSFTMMDGKASGATSADSSSYSALSFAMGLRQPTGTPDPSSAISSVYSDRGGDGGAGMERGGSGHGLPDLEKLSLEKGRNLDVEDLDDDGWRAASEAKKIIELGSLGEGAGGAVTRCRLEGGKTVFALKVSCL